MKSQGFDAVEDEDEGTTHTHITTPPLTWWPRPLNSLTFLVPHPPKLAPNHLSVDGALRGTGVSKSAKMQPWLWLVFSTKLAGKT